jgi:hypothetical protein
VHCADCTGMVVPHHDTRAVNGVCRLRAGSRCPFNSWRSEDCGLLPWFVGIPGWRFDILAVTDHVLRHGWEIIAHLFSRVGWQGWRRALVRSTALG